MKRKKDLFLEQSQLEADQLAPGLPEEPGIVVVDDPTMEGEEHWPPVDQQLKILDQLQNRMMVSCLVVVAGGVALGGMGYILVLAGAVAGSAIFQGLSRVRLGLQPTGLAKRLFQPNYDQTWGDLERREIVHLLSRNDPKRAQERLRVRFTDRHTINTALQPGLQLSMEAEAVYQEEWAIAESHGVFKAKANR